MCVQGPGVLLCGAKCFERFFFFFSKPFSKSFQEAKAATNGVKDKDKIRRSAVEPPWIALLECKHPV